MTSITDTLEGLAKSAAVIFLGSVIGRIIGLFGEAIIVRSLAPGQFGHIALTYTIVSSCGSVALLGVPEGVTRLLSSETNSKNQLKILKSGYLICIFSGILSAITIYFLRYRISAVMNDEYLQHYIVLFLPYLLIFPLANVSFAALRAQKRSFDAVISKNLGARVLALFSLGILLAVGLPSFGAAVYWVSVPFFLALLATRFVNHDFNVCSVIDEKITQSAILKLWSFSWPLAFGSMIFLLLSNLDILMIGYFLEPSSVGYYRAIQPLRQLPTFVLTAFTFFYLPVATEHFVNNRTSELNSLYRVSTKWIILVTFPPILVFALFSSSVVQVFFTAEYLPAAPVLSILTAGLFFRAIVGLDGDMVKAIDRPRIELVSALIGMTANFLLNIMLIPRLGIIGAAVATVIGYFIYNMVEVSAIYYYTGIHPFALKNLKPIVPTLGVAVALMHMTSGIDLGALGLVIVGILISIAQIISLVLTHSVEEADLFLIEKAEKQLGRNFTWVKSTLENFSG
ncbi:flippase [Halegenticoccus tardaugens]|uniref:flippase n=1 Tax=Halegenticoccus tardaugens TaxID=2071624 RepID=UPI00100B1DB7|nr:flippase [Halegenticoccus tardaugens]